MAERQQEQQQETPTTTTGATNSADTSRNQLKTIKCALLGTGSVGKTTLLATYVTKSFPGFVPPGPFDWCEEEFGEVVKKPVLIGEDTEMHFLDTIGTSDYDRLRPLQCAGADVYLLCYDVSVRDSLQEIRDTWVPNMKRYSGPHVPFVLVGLKTDIRSEAEAAGKDMSKFISYKEGEAVAKKLRASFFAESSSKVDNDLSSVFEKAKQALLQKGSHECVCS